jgi:hypothetical protein
MSNIRNFGLSSNILFNSTMFDEQQVYSVQTVDIPGMSVNHLVQDSPAGTFVLPGNIVSFEPLKLSIIVDEHLDVWNTFYNYLQNYHVVGTTDYHCNKHEISWLEIYDNKNNYLFKIEFNNCYLKSVSSLKYASDANDSTLSVDIEILYDYYTIVK